MKIYTRTGDDGSTGLFGGGRVSKYHPRVVAYGELDELSSTLGAARAALDDGTDPANDDGGSGGIATIAGRIAIIQGDLLTIGAQFASSRNPSTFIEPESIPRLEGWIDEADALLPPLQTFILPGGSMAGAMLHLARTVCRRAERAAWQLKDGMQSGAVDPGKGDGDEEVSSASLIYLNRLSDLCFMWARVANQLVGRVETPWLPRKQGG
ncbi:MAG: cob(I)yrinic acid a,c-diamide adenosyltransferase [Planctomycetota bacterium]